MSSEVAALVRERGGRVRVEPATVRAPGPGEVRVRIAATGICATDLHGIDGGAGERFPAVFGHEGAGVVEVVGDGVERVRVGDHVILTFAACHTCRACVSGHPSLCAEFAARNYGTPADIALADGGTATGGWLGQSSWASHVVVDARAAVPIPADIPWDVAAALGCGVLTGAGTVFNVLAPAPGDTLLVIGAGTTGLAAVMAARVRGVTRIVVSDPSDARRALARELGASDVLAPDELAPHVRGAATHVLDTVGVQDSLDAAIDALAVGGTCATVALHAGRNRLELSQSKLLWGRRLVGVIEGDAVPDRDIGRLVALWRSDAFPVERLITCAPFADIATAVDAVREARVVKPILLLDAAATSATASRPHTDLLSRAVAGELDEDDLPGIWNALPPVHPDELRGLWRGWGLSPSHRMTRMLTRSDWYGKLFVTSGDVAPIVCLRDGHLREDAALSRGGASVRWTEHDGIRTAAMAYDHLPIVDAFVRLAPDAVMGVMTGRDAADGGRLFHFVLERAAPQHVERDTTYRA